MIRITEQPASPNFTSTRNACKLCTPLGACLAYFGVEGAVPFLHGSQGCATYIRRYMISHFREPMDIASSSFGEHAAIFGGSDNFRTGLANVICGYEPKMVGVATTCLSETIGDDVPMMLREFYAEHEADPPPIVHASTASYQGTHASGYLTAVRSIVETLAEPKPKQDRTVNLIPGMVSPADLRHLRDVLEDFGLTPIILPDYSDRLDGQIWPDYQRIPDGGTPVEDVRQMGAASATLEMVSTANAAKTAGAWLADRCDVAHHVVDWPIGVRLNDLFFERLSKLADRPVPRRYADQRGRLVDSYVDAHKYVAGRRVLIYGEEDLVVAMAAFCAEVGLTPVVIASGGESRRLDENIARVAPALTDECVIRSGADFEDITAIAKASDIELIVGHSKGYKLARQLDVPLVRVGFPIHDRFGGARIQHVGYAGTQQLFDRIVNALLARKQADSAMGFTYL